LNLYRYPEEARNDLITILERVSERLWIPHQVALEYQASRLGVIAEQLEQFSAVRETLEEYRTELENNLNKLQLKKRHATIDPDDLLNKIKSILSDFLERLKILEQDQPNVNDPDNLREKIDSIFKGKIGPPPKSQEVLNQIYQEGEIRYENRWPPGYMDEDKSKDDRSVYIYGGLIFKREYGDLIIWKQIIQKAQKDPDFKNIVYITDDDKEDWWWNFESQGKKTIGPRPELVDEITREGEVKQFYMYNSERFMTFAEKYLDIQVKQESIDQVRDAKHAYTRGAYIEKDEVFPREGRHSNIVAAYLSNSMQDNGFFTIPVKSNSDLNKMRIKSITDNSPYRYYIDGAAGSEYFVIVGNDSNEIGLVHNPFPEVYDKDYYFTLQEFIPIPGKGHQRTLVGPSPIEIPGSKFYKVAKRLDNYFYIKIPANANW
jgi:hypothetical protein